MIERLEVVEEPRKEWELRMEIAAAPRAGAVVATLRGRRGPPRRLHLGPVDLQIDWADRVAITGANGSGKSTLLAALLGRLPLDAGHAALGPGVVVGEVDQARGLFLGDEPLLDAFGAAVPDTGTGRRPHAAGQVRPARRPRAAPGGDACRRASAPAPRWRCCRRRGVNLLVLDEPTNHLDLPAIEQLESALDALPGHAAAGHPRPPDAGRGAHHPPPRGRGRPGHRSSERADGTGRTQKYRSWARVARGDPPHGSGLSAPGPPCFGSVSPARRSASAIALFAGAGAPWPCRDPSATGAAAPVPAPP